jgi:OOP family OmpA-OmpF porin
MKLLAGVGVDTSRVHAEWEPYLSSDPEVVAARAVRTLEPPTGVSLAVTGDTLIFTGTADSDWADAAGERAITIAGVSMLDRSGLVARLPAQLVELQRRLESHRVLFPPGGTEIVPDARDSLQAIAASLALLREATSALGYDMVLEVVGRTDSTGLSETNRALSHNRAEAVRARLVALGAVDAGTPTRGIGTSSPLEGLTASDRSRVNRSTVVEVSFRRGVGRVGSRQ